MSKTPLYKMLQDVPSSGGWTLATLLDGQRFRQSAAFAGG